MSSTLEAMETMHVETASRPSSSWSVPMTRKTSCVRVVASSSGRSAGVGRGASSTARRRSSRVAVRPTRSSTVPANTAASFPHVEPGAEESVRPRVLQQRVDVQPGRARRSRGDERVLHAREVAEEGVGS